MKTFSYQDELVLPVPLDQVFSFFADARNLEKLTPPWLSFEVLTGGPITMAAGTLIDYRIRWRGVPLRWRTEIEAWEPPHRFVDRQIRGPYRLWRHEHLFIDRGNGTSIIDRVEYAPIGGVIAQRLVVARDVKRIFAYRHGVLRRDFWASSLQAVNQVMSGFQVLDGGD
jgi:ligand-binding SRPBCC domain-containing protein